MLPLREQVKTYINIKIVLYNGNIKRGGEVSFSFL